MNPLQWILSRLIRGYQLFLSPLKSALFGAAAKCRFTPTCSQYALEAIRTHGAIKGTWLGFRRLLRCNPWGGWGPDPVPEKVERKSELKEEGRKRDDRGECELRAMLPNAFSNDAVLNFPLLTLNYSQPFD